MLHRRQIVNAISSARPITAICLVTGCALLLIPASPVLRRLQPRCTAGRNISGDHFSLQVITGQTPGCRGEIMEQGVCVPDMFRTIIKSIDTDMPLAAWSLPDDVSGLVCVPKIYSVPQYSGTGACAERTSKGLEKSFSSQQAIPPSGGKGVGQQAIPPSGGKGVGLRGALYTIPVIIHIIHDPALPGDADPYPNDDAVIAGIDWINNLLAGNPACPGDPASVETGIRLCLATRDIEGSPTTGINRYAHALTDMDLCRDDIALKAIPRQGGDDLYPHTGYINIYIVREICASCQPADCLAGGFAAYPAAHGKPYDGIVIEAFTWMYHDCDVRKVILHELGHYFNLRHTWEGGGCHNDDCLTDGDQVCDTPPDSDVNFYPSNACMQGLPVNSCFNDANPADPNNLFSADQPDMTSNLMDYAPPACIAVFTPGQAERMIGALEGPRASLLASQGCEPPCTNPITLDIQWPVSPVLFGSPVQITTTGQHVASWRWSWYGGVATSQTFLFPADSTGVFEICLEATGSGPECRIKECRTIEVACTLIEPAFTLSSYQLDHNETLTLTQTSPREPGYTYTWYINGEAAGHDEIMTYIPDHDGSYAVWLDACRAACCSSSIHAYFAVGICPTGREANHWLLGNDSIHLDWNSGIPVEQPPSGIGSDEAMAVAVDANGQLLFYSNASRVMNRHHQLMPNGRISSNQSVTHALTVPMPGSDSLWFLFYPQALDNFSAHLDTTTKLYMAIIDMSLDGGGGAVTTKDHILLEPTTEKVAAIRHCNGADWWILGHEAGSNRFFAWLLTRDGLMDPVISSVGISAPKYISTKTGEMNFSSNGLRIAMSTGPSYPPPPLIPPVPIPPPHPIELFDFDPLSGTVNNAITLGAFQSSIPGLGTAYGLEFSPSSEFLYLARGAFFDTILQYDLSNPSPSAILQSRTAIYGATVSSDDGFGGMLTGPDGNIYVANLNKAYLGVIQNPNIQGSGANFISRGMELQRGRCFVGLPTFPAGIHTPGKPWLKGPYTLCDTIAEAKYYVASNCRYQDYDWHIEGTSQVLRTLGDTVWIRPGLPGTDRLIVDKYTACGTKSDTFDITIEACDPVITPCSIDFAWSEADTVICRGEDAWLRFYTQADVVRYTLASDGISRLLHSATLVIPQPAQSDQVSIHLATYDGCDTTITVGIHVNPPLDVQLLSADTLVCAGETAALSFLTLPSQLVEIFPHDLGWVITNPTWPLAIGPLVADTTLYARIRDHEMGCDSFYSWQIRVEQEERVTHDTLHLCRGDSVNVGGIWYAADTLITETLARPGCDSSHHTRIILSPGPEANITAYDPCQGDNGGIGIIMTSGLAPFAYTLNAGSPQSDPLFSGLGAGTYHLAITDAAGCRFDTIIMLEEGTGLAGITSEIIHASCDLDNGSITLHAPQPGVMYKINDSPFKSGNTFIDLPAATYTIIAAGAAGCTDTFDIGILQHGTPVITGMTTTPAHCGRTDGNMVIAEITGGLPPYRIQMGSGTPDTVTLYTGLPAGVYTVSVIDSNHCISSLDIVIDDLPPPVIDDIRIRPALCGLPVGSVEVHASSQNGLLYGLGNTPFAANPVFDDLLPGIYTIIVADTFDCLATAQVIVPDSFSYTITAIDIRPATCGDQNGSITVHTTGAGLTIRIDELPGRTFDHAVDALGPGSYHLRLRDEMMCVSDTVIHIPSSCDIYMPNVFSPNGDGINDIFGQIDGITFDLWELTVFDRSGNIVYYTTDPPEGWNGRHKDKEVQSGVYVWMLRYRLQGETEVVSKGGDVMVMR